MRRLRSLRVAAAALALFLLVACGQHAPGVQQLELSGVSPVRGARSGGTQVTISGAGLFTSEQPGFASELSVLVCGAPLTDLQVVDGASRRFVLPGGGVGSITEGAAITGLTSAMAATDGNVVVTRPDGQTATLEGVFDCFDPAPVVQRFELATSGAEARSFEPVTFHVAAGDPDGQALSCTLDPGDGSAPYVAADCRAPIAQTHTYTASGSYTAVLSVANASATTTRELLVEVADLGTPTAVDDRYEALAGYRLAVPAASGLLANDTLRTATITTYDAVSGRGSVVVVAPDGSFIFDTDPTAGPLPYTDTFSYTIANPAGAATATASVVVTLPAASASESSLVVDRPTLTADGVDSATVTVVLRDAQGRQLPRGIAGAVTLAVEPAGASLSALTDNGDGSYSATLIAPERSGAATLTAYVDGQVLPDDVALEFVAGPAHTLSVSQGDGATLVVAGSHTVAVLVTDAYDNPVPGASVHWSTAFGHVASATTSTDATGRAATTWELATTPGAQTLIATATGPGGTPLAGSPFTFEVTAVIGAADPERSTVTASHATITAGGAGTTITVTLFDSYGNRLTAGGSRVRLALSGGGSLIPAEPTDVGDGRYVATFAPGTRAGTRVITASLDGTPIADSATVEVVAGAASSLGLAFGGSGPVEAGAGFPLTLTALDAHGNVASSWSGSYTLVFAGAGAAPDGTAPTATDRASLHVPFGTDTELQFSAGVATTTVTLYQAGSAALTARQAGGSVAAAAALSVTVELADAAALVVTPSAVELSAVGATAGLTARLTDTYANPFTVADLTWTSADTAVASVAGSGLTGTVTAVGGGSATVTADAGGVTGSATVNVTLPPSSMDDGFEVAVGTVLSANVLGNDDLGYPAATVVSFGGGNLAGTSATLPAGSDAAFAGGTLSLAADGSLTLRDHTEDGIHDFSYVISNVGGSSVATVSVEVQAPPVALDDGPAAASAPSDAFHTALGSTLNVDAATGLLANDTLNDPAAAIDSFGAIVLVDSMGNPGAALGTVTSYAAGSTVAIGADGQLSVAADGAVTFTPPTGYTGPVAFRYRLTNDVGFADAGATLAVGVRPAAAADTYDVLGNVGIDVPAAAGLLANDAGDLLRFISYGTGALPGSATASNQGGSIAATGDGGFAYDPAAGFQGGDSLDYVIANGFGNVTGSVTFTVADAIWFVDAAAASAGDGTLGRPFRSLADVAAGLDAGTIAAQQAIFLHGSSTPYDGGVLRLKDGQRLVGQPATGSLAGLAGVTPPTYSRSLPALQPVGLPSRIQGNGAAITLAADNHLYGLILGNDAGTQPTLLGSSFGTLTVRDTSILGGAMGLVDLTGGTVDAEFASVSGANTARHIALTGVGGRLGIGAGTLHSARDASIQLTSSDLQFTFGGTVQVASGGGYSLAVSGGAPTIALSGNIADAGMGLLVTGLSGGSVTLSGASKVFHTGVRNAITFDSSAGARLAVVGGGLALHTTTGRGIHAAGGGSLAVTGEDNIVASGTGTAVLVSGTIIAPEGLRFRSITHSGGANGVVLDGTGAGSFTVTGDGTAGSGGRIANVVGADGSSGGNSFHLVDTANVSLSHMVVDGSSNHGLYADRVAGLTLTGMTFTGDHGTTADGTFTEGVVKLLDVTGLVSATSSTFDGGFANAFRVLNMAPGDLTLRFSGNTVAHMQGSQEDVGGTALLVDIQAGSADVSVDANAFTHWWGNAVDVVVRGNGTGLSRITNNVASNTSGALAGSGGIRVGGGDHRYRIAGNTVVGSNGTAISADRTGAGALMSGTIENNVIGDPLQTESGSYFGGAIYASHTGPNQTVVRIHGNTIRQTRRTAGGTIGLAVGDHSTSGGSGSFDAIVTGNDIAAYAGPPTSTSMGIYMNVGRTTGDADVACLDIGGPGALANRIDDGAALVRIRVNQRFDTTARFPGYTGAALGSGAELASYLLARNVGPNLGALAGNPVGGGYQGSASCQQPAM